MPGSPATAPRSGAPRYSDADAVSFSTQVNAITDAFDAAFAARTAAEGNVLTRATAYTAAPGDAVICTAALTITLPSAPATAADSPSVMVVAEGGDVTVNRGGTDTITQYGTTGATSITVRSGTMTRLRYVGTVWHVVQSFNLSGDATWGGQTKAQIVAGNPPQAHKATHEPGGADALTALTDANVAAANKDGADGTASLRTLGVAAGKAAGGDRVGWQGIARAGSFNAAVGQMNYCTGAMTATLPTAPSADAECGIVALTGTVTVSRGGTDTINQYQVGALTSITVPAGSSVVLKYLSGVWYLVRDTRPIGHNTSCYAYLNSTTFVPTHDAYAVVPIETVVLDRGGNFNTGTHRYTVVYPGDYQVDAQAEMNQGAGAPLIGMSVSIFKSAGASPVISGDNLGADGEFGITASGKAMGLVAGDFLDVRVYANNATTPGSAVPSLSGGVQDLNFISVHRVA